MEKKEIYLIILGVIILSGIITFIIFNQEKEIPQDNQTINQRCGDGICGPIEKQRGICPQDCNNIPVQNNSNNFSGEVNKNANIFIAIHLEPGRQPKTTTYQEINWPNLVAIVNLADKYNQKLTLEFNPQWVTYILNTDKLSIVRGWEAEGHEIAVHHHGPDHPSWNGYTNCMDCIRTGDESKYIGTVEDMMNLVSQLSASGTILTGGVTNEIYDWPEGVIYDTTGGTEKTDLISTPTKINWAGDLVTQLKYRMYAVTDDYAKYPDADLSEIQQGLSTIKDTEVMGLVFHGFNYPTHSQEIEDLFSYFNSQNLHSKTVSTILS